MRQLISFAATWSGSRIYLEGVFPYASLLFAIAIQATAYFFSNSIRSRVSLRQALFWLKHLTDSADAAAEKEKGLLRSYASGLHYRSRNRFL